MKKDKDYIETDEPSDDRRMLGEPDREHVGPEPGNDDYENVLLNKAVLLYLERGNQEVVLNQAVLEATQEHRLKKENPILDDADFMQRCEEWGKAHPNPGEEASILQLYSKIREFQGHCKAEEWFDDAEGDQLLNDCASLLLKLLPPLIQKSVGESLKSS